MLGSGERAVGEMRRCWPSWAAWVAGWLRVVEAPAALVAGGSVARACRRRAAPDALVVIGMVTVVEGVLD